MIVVGYFHITTLLAHGPLNVTRVLPIQFGQMLSANEFLASRHIHAALRATVTSWPIAHHRHRPTTFSAVTSTGFAAASSHASIQSSWMRRLRGPPSPAG